MSMVIEYQTTKVPYSVPAEYKVSRADSAYLPVIRHEWGHILGFRHEGDRTDSVPSGCTSLGTTAGYDPLTVSGVGVADPKSIMEWSYCGYTGNNDLSPSDIQGARRLYGWRDAADYDNSGAADAVVWRPSTGQWWVNGTPIWAEQFGENGDIPIAGDFDRDGKSDIAVWRPSGPYTGWWFIKNSSGATGPGGFPGQSRFQFGWTGDIPTYGDTNGDGVNEPIVYRPSTNSFYILVAGNTITVPFGQNGDIPVLADYDGDGITDLAVWRPSIGLWFIRESAKQPAQPGYYSMRYYGVNGDIPVVGDFDGDNKSDYAVWRPSNGYFYVLPWNGGAAMAVQWGANGDVPVPGDYNGDAVTDFAVWRPSTGTFYMKGIAAIALGQTGDIPVARRQ